MTTNDLRRSVLLIGKSQLVLDESIAGLRDLGYHAEATNDFSDVTPRFDIKTTDLVVFGGQVPPDRKAELREEIESTNPLVIFVEGLAGIPGLIIDQIQGAFTPARQDHTPAAYELHDRSIRLHLAGPAEVKVIIWWQTEFVPPDPRSDSVVLLDDYLAEGDHTVTLPDHIPARACFATVRAGAAIHAFRVAARQ